MAITQSQSVPVKERIYDGGATAPDEAACVFAKRVDFHSGARVGRFLDVEDGYGHGDRNEEGGVCEVFAKAYPGCTEFRTRNKERGTRTHRRPKPNTTSCGSSSGIPSLPEPPGR